MTKVKIYLTTFCPYCVAAKELLETLSIDFEEVNLTGKQQELAELKASTGMNTVPQVFIGEELIGGYTELAALQQTGELEKKLSSL